MAVAPRTEHIRHTAPVVVTDKVFDCEWLLAFIAFFGNVHLKVHHHRKEYAGYETQWIEQDEDKRVA